MKRFLIVTALLLACPDANAQNSQLSDAERAAIQKAREFCIETMGGQEKLNSRMVFGGDNTANDLHTQLNECVIRMMPRYLPHASH